MEDCHSGRHGPRVLALKNRAMTDITARPTALVVEPNYLIAASIELPLVEHGYDVLMAADNVEALRFLEGHTIHVALLDFRLHYGGPKGLVAELTSRGVPHMFCTAASIEEVHEQFPGAVVVPKPFSDEQLIARLARYVSPPWVRRPE